MSALQLPADLPPLTVLAGPERVGSELRWRVRLGDGRPAALGVLLPELARDPALRRRYVRDLERLRHMAVPAIAPLVALGPTPHPRDPRSPPPWRLRLDPPGETLADWLQRRAPAPIDEASELVARLADALAQVHAAGAVLRDLHPRWVVLGPEGAVWLTDVGLSRVDILSTRTAASLLLEGSPYASPEQFQRTALDQRADLYGLGAILFQALTGALPRGEGPASLAGVAAPPPSALRPGVPPALDRLVLRCLSDDPEQRPRSAGALARALRGEPVDDPETARVPCQACGASLRPGQRLCLRCGKQAVLFEHAAAGLCAIELTEAEEGAEFLERLRGRLDELADRPVPALNLVIGDKGMYSKTELARRLSLPLRLFADLSEETAERLRARLAASGFKVRTVTRSLGARARITRRVALWVAAFYVPLAAIALLLGAPWAVQIVLGALALTLGGLISWGVIRERERAREPLLRLRPAPAALPASDPWVARLAALLDARTAPDLRERLGELALLVQRLVDRRAELRGGAAAELAMVTEPVGELVGLIERHARRLQEVDATLGEHEEGGLVRALAVSEARGEPASARAGLLDALDRLRALEDERARIFHHLLEAAELLRRAVELGLEVRDPEGEHARQVALALAALGPAQG